MNFLASPTKCSLNYQLKSAKSTNKHYPITCFYFLILFFFYCLEVGLAGLLSLSIFGAWGAANLALKFKIEKLFPFGF